MLIRPVRQRLDEFQTRVARLSALLTINRHTEDVTIQVRLLCAEIDNANHAFRMELQNQPRSIRETDGVRDALKALRTARKGARGLLGPVTQLF